MIDMDDLIIQDLFKQAKELVNESHMLDRLDPESFEKHVQVSQRLQWLEVRIEARMNELATPTPRPQLRIVPRLRLVK